MPKKFQGENSKAVVAKARKAEKAATEKAIKEKAEEDAYWKEDDKLICKKLQRKEEKERKRVEEAQKRQERKLLEEIETQEIEPVIATSQKVTVYQLEKQKEERSKLLGANQKEEIKSHLDTPLQENLNRLDTETITATGIDAAVAALSVNDSKPDKHPEKRMAAAYRTFDANRLPQLKKENPNMRHTQLKQLLRKEWQKSPQNPLNQV